MGCNNTAGLGNVSAVLHWTQRFICLFPRQCESHSRVSGMPWIACKWHYSHGNVLFKPGLLWLSEQSKFSSTYTALCSFQPPSFLSILCKNRKGSSRLQKLQFWALHPQKLRNGRRFQLNFLLDLPVCFFLGIFQGLVIDKREKLFHAIANDVG